MQHPRAVIALLPRSLGIASPAAVCRGSSGVPAPLRPDVPERPDRKVVCPVKKIILAGFVFCALGAAASEPAAARPQDGRGAAVYYRDGTRFALEGRLNEAAAAFEQAIRLDPENGDAYFSLGNVYSEQGRWADAVGAYRKAVALRKKDGEAYNSLGVALGRRGEYE